MNRCPVLFAKSYTAIRDEGRSTVVTFVALFALMMLVSGSAIAQNAGMEFPGGRENPPNPKMAFLRSIVMPGWGHYYVNHNNWTRGKYHLAGEVILLASYFGLNTQSNRLQTDLYTQARSYAGVDIEGRSRGFKLAVGDYDNLEAYNADQERSRNWDQLYPNKVEYQWNWTSKKARQDYLDTKNRIDKIDRQLPALFSLMIVNRVVSGVSAYLRAKDMVENWPDMQVGYANPALGRGVVARFRFDF